MEALVIGLAALAAVVALGTLTVLFVVVGVGLLAGLFVAVVELLLEPKVAATLLGVAVALLALAVAVPVALAWFAP